jgi:hypothetical protein
MIRPAPRRPLEHPRRVGRDVPRVVTFCGNGRLGRKMRMASDV